MADGTKISWSDATWNPITGCSVISPGCTNCYAMKLAGGRLRNHPSRAGLTIDSKSGPVWTGEVRFNEQWLLQPLFWTKPRMIFVCAHADLFHKHVRQEWIDRIFAVMSLCPQHIFQVLTKRPDLMRQYVNDPDLPGRLDKERDKITSIQPGGNSWPLPNVWLGVSAEDQIRADDRIPHLRATPAAVRFVSAEPLLSGLDLQPHGLFDGEINWVIAGGESGPNARPMYPDWARSLRDQCAAAGVAFHFKQWGEWVRWEPKYPAGKVVYVDECGVKHTTPMIDREPMVPVGKKASGRLLDGRTHDDFPVSAP